MPGNQFSLVENQERLKHAFVVLTAHIAGSVSSQPIARRIREIVKWYGTNVDIEDRKRAEEELRRSEFYLSEGQRLAHMGSWVLDAAGCFPYWSHELFHIYGLDPAKEGPSFEEYLANIHPQDREFMRSLINRILQRPRDVMSPSGLCAPAAKFGTYVALVFPIVENGTLKKNRWQRHRRYGTRAPDPGTPSARSVPDGSSKTQSHRQLRVET